MKVPLRSDQNITLPICGNNVCTQPHRIRALLGSVRSLDRVLESNFALLHCSPTRLLEIWDTLRTVCWVVQTKVTPLMEKPSVLPDLDEAVRNARDTLTFLDSEVFAHIDRFPDRPEEQQLDELRKTLCITIGKLHGFLVDTLGEILAADPRSQHDVDSFSPASALAMSGIEWLETSVRRLDSDRLAAERATPRRPRIRDRHDGKVGPPAVTRGVAASGGFSRRPRVRFRTEAQEHRRASRHPLRGARGPAGTHARSSRVLSCRCRALRHGRRRPRYPLFGSAECGALRVRYQRLGMGLVDVTREADPPSTHRFLPGDFG